MNHCRRTQTRVENGAKTQQPASSPGTNFSKVCSMVVLHRIFCGELTFENICQTISVEGKALSMDDANDVLYRMYNLCGYRSPSDGMCVYCNI